MDDIKLPNRRTARDGPGGAAAPSTTTRSDINALRGEIDQLSAAVGGGGGSYRRGAGGAGGRNAAGEHQHHSPPEQQEDEVTSLYHELQRASAKLESEKAQRKRAESELESIRQNRLRETSDVVQELERKRIELNTLREERTVMKEWLDRGVNECRRVAEEVGTLKSDLQASEQDCVQLNRDRQRLATTIQQLTDELAAVQSALETAHHEKAMLEMKADESTSTMTRAEEQRKLAIGECDRLSSEVVRLSQRVRGLEDAELSMQSMCSCMEQLVAEIAVLEGNISKGDLDASLLDVGRDMMEHAANDIRQPKPLPTMVIEAKRLLQNLQDSTGKLRATVKRYAAGKQQDYADLKHAHQREHDEIIHNRDTIVAQNRAEVDALQKRIHDLEKEIVLVADGVQRDSNQEAAERLAALDRVTQSNRELTDTCENLRQDNERLKAKARKMKIDWAKVDESRRRFQQLQTEMQMMQEQAERLTKENRNLKLYLEGSTGLPADLSGSTPTNGTRTPNRGGGAASPAALGGTGDRPRTVQLHRQAFDEWKQRAIQSNNGSSMMAAGPGMSHLSPY